MEFSCNLENLKKIANDVSLAINIKNSTIPILEGMLLECEKNILKLTGYNLSLGIIKTLKVNQKKEGKVVLKATIFVEILKKLDNEEIVFISVDKNLITTIKTKTTEFTISGINSISYPNLPEIEKENSIKIKNKTLKEAIFKTIFAVSNNNNNNPTLSGCLFKIYDNNLKIVSLDGYRIAISYSLIENNNINTEFIVSSKTLNEISKILDEDETKETIIEISNNHIVFQISGYYVISRLLQGKFLDYKAAIPKSCETEIIINPEILEKSLQKVSAIITTKISVTMKISKNIISVNCESPIGKAKDSIETKTIGKELEKIAFNNRFMLDALKHCRCDLVKIGFNGPIMPITLKPEKDSDFLYLVLPVRLK